MIKRKNSTRAPESVETVAHRGDIQTSEDSFEGIPNMGVDDWRKWWKIINKQGVKGGQRPRC